MKAQEMRKITEQSEIEKANEFWEEFKGTLFEGLKRQAECRQYSIAIGCLDRLGKTNQGCSWIDIKHLREKVKKELESLGYKFSYSNAQQGESINISW